MPHPTKKQRLEGHPSAAVAAGDDSVASFDDLADLLPNVLGFLLLEDIMRSRRINKRVKEAARKTIVPRTDFCVDSVENYNAMAVMTTELPNLQQITLRKLGYGHKYSDGEDPDEDEVLQYTSHDIGIISNFSKLRDLTIHTGYVNGRYPFLFNNFPLLQKLRIRNCRYLKWDLDMLAGFPVLKELDCEHNHRMTGNIDSLRVLKDTIEKVRISMCSNVEGNLMDLADFPHLKELDVDGTAVTGDIRDIGDNDFSVLEYLGHLPKGVYGGWGYEFRRISDGPDLIRTLYLFKKQRPALKMNKDWYGELSADSPDWYESADYDDNDTPPFSIRFVQAGSRGGFQWETIDEDDPCEVNWLDPEPERESSDYEEYIAELQKLDRKLGMYRGFHQPPTEEEYNILVDDYCRYSEDESFDYGSDEDEE